MLPLKLLLLLALNNQGLIYVAMEDESLIDDEVATLIYVIGCGEWENFTFITSGNQITASANVPERFINCTIDPAPPQFWNRIPLTHFPAGQYSINLTLNGPNQSIVGQFDFIVTQGNDAQAVPIGSLMTLAFLAACIFIFGSITHSKQK